MCTQAAEDQLYLQLLLKVVKEKDFGNRYSEEEKFVIELDKTARE